MKRLLLLFCLFLSVFASYAQEKPGLGRPKLIVGIMVDQMRWDYLYRFYDRYGEGGLKRLMRDGFNCQNTMINYLPSFTGPGHASAYTGSVPSINGIAANDWFDTSGQNLYCTADLTVQPINGSCRAGQMSPRNLLTSTITDELRLATNMKSKVFGISLKDRSSIFPAGHLANAAYWLDDSTGNLMTSSFYHDQLPDWLVRFNNRGLADSLVRLKWETLYPINTYSQSITDDNKYEKLFPEESKPVFPHLPPQNQFSIKLLRYRPEGNTFVFKAARACIKGEALGKGSATDFLCLSFSSTDYVGHEYAPNSIEMEDIFLRFDKELAAFLNYLDDNIGEGNYLLFLSADHGGAHNANYLRDIKMPAGMNTEPEILAGLNNALKQKIGKDSLVSMYTNYQVYLDERRIVRFKLDRKQVKAEVIRYLDGMASMAYVIDMEEFDRTVVPEPIRTMVINGYNKQRSGSIQVVLRPGWYDGYAPTGTTHGSWNPYDTHIPLLWYGHGIKKGQTHRTVNITDIAPTLAALLHIQMPNGCVGNVVTEITD